MRVLQSRLTHGISIGSRGGDAESATSRVPKEDNGRANRVGFFAVLALAAPWAASLPAPADYSKILAIDRVNNTPTGNLHDLQGCAGKHRRSRGGSVPQLSL